MALAIQLPAARVYPNWEARAETGALQCGGPHATNIHGAMHDTGQAYTRTAAKGASYPWRENLLGLTQTMQVAMHLTWVPAGSSQPCAVAFALDHAAPPIDMIQPFSDPTGGGRLPKNIDPCLIP